MKFIEKTKKEKSANPFSIQAGRHGKLQSSYRILWPEEAYLENSVRHREILKAEHVSANRFRALAAAVFALCFLLAGRIAWLQIAKGEYYYQMAEGNRIRLERIEARRGVIYDRAGLQLVRNTANFMLYLIPADLPRAKAERDALLTEISAALGLPGPSPLIGSVESVRNDALESMKPLFIADNIPYETAMSLYIRSDAWSGVVISSKSRRAYDLPASSLSHILGYTGKISQEELDSYGGEYLPIDYTGKMGIEYFWEGHLRGTNGQKQIEVDALGKEKNIVGEKAATDGRNLVLTIDSRIQKKLEEVLKSQLSALRLTRSAAIVLEPGSGEVLAMVSLPAYDNNIFARGASVEEYRGLLDNPDKPLINRAISGEYASGSTIKPVIAAAALEEHIVSEHTTVLSSGGIRVGQWFFPDWLAGGHGTTDVRKAIAQSVNTFFYQVGGGYQDAPGLGVERIGRYCMFFGLGSQTGIDLTGEADGFIPTKEWKEETKKESWYIGDTYHLAIGQGDLIVTPLQVAAYTAVFANGGALYRPHVVRMVLTGKNEIISMIREEPVRKDFIDPYNMKVVREGMRMTVTSGSARSLQAVPAAVAGKTGTAQWSSKKPPHAWFTGFAPFDKPEITITILIEEGKEGSTAAVPIAKEFLEWYFRDYKGATSTPAQIPGNV